MPHKKPANALNLNTKNVDKAPPTPEQAAAEMATFYSVMGDCLLNLVAIHETISKNIDALAVDTNDIAFYLKKMALANDSVSTMEIEEHEGETEEDDPGDSLGN